MSAQHKRYKALSYAFWIFASLLLLSGCSSGPDTSHSPTAVTGNSGEVSLPVSGPWQILGVYNVSHNIMTAGFLDEQYAATGGVSGQMAYSSDSAETWLVTDSLADCRYGMDIVSPQVIWTCGGATHVRKSVDGGRTWQILAAFGDPRTIRGACYAASFLDENTGWLANSNMFGTTTDGGTTWNLRSLPETAQKIATIDTYLPGEGYLLDQRGVLFFTKDDGRHWEEKSRIGPDMLEIPPSAYQLAAMRFSNADHGMVVVSSSPFGKESPVLAFHTSDGGETWTSEAVPVLAGPVYLSRHGGFLTVITGANQVSLLRYAE